VQIFSRDRRALCGICPAGCWIVASLDRQGRLAAMRPDEISPLGIVCKLGEHSPEIVYSPHRLKTPLRRKGPKGTLSFEPISWDEAFGDIVGRLNAIKAESAIYTGRGSFELE
jgi:anaerobic selenocysteine-containing dehydrogenase